MKILMVRMSKNITQRAMIVNKQTFMKQQIAGSERRMGANSSSTIKSSDIRSSTIPKFDSVA